MISKTSIQIISALASGLLIILLSQIIISAISFVYFQYQATHLTIEEFKNVSNTFSSQIVNFLTSLIGLLAFTFAGFVAGKKIKEKEWLYAGVVGILWFMLIVFLALSPFLLPKNLIYGPKFPVEMVQTINEKRVNNFISGIPISFLKIVGFTILGGWISGYIKKSKTNT